jgi:hypothetical protein
MYDVFSLLPAWREKQTEFVPHAEKQTSKTFWVLQSFDAFDGSNGSGDERKKLAVL